MPSRISLILNVDPLDMRDALMCFMLYSMSDMPTLSVLTSNSQPGKSQRSWIAIRSYDGGLPILVRLGRQSTSRPAQGHDRSAREFDFTKYVRDFK